MRVVAAGEFEGHFQRSLLYLSNNTRLIAQVLTLILSNPVLVPHLWLQFELMVV